MTMIRVLFVASNPADSYSGGRYHAWIMAEALAANGCQVSYWTNESPLLIESFREFPAHETIRLLVDRDFSNPPRGPFDFVIAVPQMTTELALYRRCLAVAHSNRARLVLLNFESGNWFNAYAPEKRDIGLWNGWKLIARHADLVLSSTEEGDTHAKTFYDIPSGSRFRWCEPAINSVVADSVQAQPEDGSILAFARIDQQSIHKGSSDLLDAVGPEMAGRKLRIIIGHGILDEEFAAEIRRVVALHGANLEFLRKPTDQQKFAYMKSCSLLLMLSYFEGYGYPALEALYCQKPCVCYDLPVLRETCGGDLFYAKAGCLEDVRRQIDHVLSKRPQLSGTLQKRIAEVVAFDRYRERLAALFDELAGSKSPPSVLSVSRSERAQWRNTALLD
jgi:glycosyltransferase involved in cell wall biosynthesis